MTSQPQLSTTPAEAPEAALRAAPHLVLLPHHRRQRPATDTTLQRRHDQRRVLQVTGVIGPGGLMQQQHAQVGWDGVEAARVHDARACAGCHVVAAVDAVPDEQHFAGQVRVVGARGGAGLNQGQPLIAVGPHRAHHDPGRPR